MKRLALLVGLILVLASAFSACSIEEGGLKSTEDGGGGTGNNGAGGTSVVGGTCFPGSKVCPDKTTGALKCLEKDDPGTSCGETSCDPCNVKNATATCTGEKCAIGSCNAGFQDCNNDPIDGCETNTNFDGKNCGTCSNACSAGKKCDGAGTCIVDTCPEPTADCDTNNTDCEVLNKQTDPNHCGFCHNVCNLANATSDCSQGVCVITSCNAGFANCDGNDANGCEKNIATDTGNCGACGKVCSATNGSAGCVGGKCGIVCAPGFGNCDGNVDTGCEVNLKTDPAHCNSCTIACSPANVNGATCNNGACGYTSCKAGFANCDGNAANGCEINILQNKSHCGGCNNVCPAPSGGQVFCANGSCAQDCGTLTLCTTTSTCVNIQSDVNNCGSCGNVCPNGPANSTKSCAGGQCKWTCNSGYTDCGQGTACYFYATDTNHCGTSCVQCSAPTGGTPYCQASACNFTCNSPLIKCGTGCHDGQTSSLHCGGCNKPCNTGGKVCSGGVCGCPGTLTDCSGTCTDTSSNDSKCGPTCATCGGGKQCVSGQCVCPSGQTDCGGTCTNTTNNDGACGPTCTNCATGTTGKTCQGTTCACPTSAPDLCGTTCVNDETNPNHCGACSNKCHSSATGCAGGVCTCASGLKYCNNTLGCKACCGDADCGGQKCCGNVCQECCSGASCGGSKICCANGTCPTGGGAGSCPDAGG